MDELVKLIRAAATDLPKDVEQALANARDRESGNARDVLDTILGNAQLARLQSKPMCQDTGTPVFYVTAPAAADRMRISEVIHKAVGKATAEVPLRPNAVDPVSGLNSGTNHAVIHFSQWDRDDVRFDLVLKGGGSENITQLYRLPDQSLDAGRDLEGVVKCVLDAVHRAQGRGCPPYIIGVGIGGLADTCLALAKSQFLRRLDDVNEDGELAGLETGLVEKINRLGIGPMGLGGASTALAVKAGKTVRHPASFFVGASFMCWAMRRWSIEVASVD